MYFGGEVNLAWGIGSAGRDYNFHLVDQENKTYATKYTCFTSVSPNLPIFSINSQGNYDIFLVNCK